MPAHPRRARDTPLETVESLRDALRARFGAAVEGSRRPTADGEPIPSGWTRVDRALDGGLRPGATALIEGSPGAGSLALASSWAQAASTRGQPVVVLDATGSTLPHAWVEPVAAQAPVWVLRFGPAGEPSSALFAGLDVALRSGAFGLALVLEPPPAPVGVGPRVARLAREHAVRLVVTQSRIDDEELGPSRRSFAGGHAPPWPPTHRIRLTAGVVRWVDGPFGAAPAARTLEVRCSDDRGVPDRTTSADGGELRRDLETDRLRAPARAPDRRPPSGRGGRTRRR